MNYAAILHQLRQEHARVVAAIAALEGITQPRRGRGRKPGMPEAERREVSARMKAYWSRRRRERAAGGAR